jgi:hypothetical protein
MTKKNLDKLADQSHISEEARRAYKGVPSADPVAETPPPTDTTVPVGQADSAGMKAVTEKPVDDAADADKGTE